MPKTIKELQERVIGLRDDRDWKQFHTPKDCAMSLCLEAAEVMEHFQWKTRDEALEYIKKEGKEVGYELVDVLFWVLTMAHDFDLDLEGIFEEKMQINEKKYPIEKSKGKKLKYTQYT